MKNFNKNKTVNLLWTGGWDSTFRLLDLVLDKNRSVQPYYLMDLNRKSTINELITMRKIKSFLNKHYPDKYHLLLPTYYKEISDIKIDSIILQAYRTIKEEKHIGSQYPWLAGFCSEQGIYGMELCAGMTPGVGISLLFEPLCEQIQVNSEVMCRVQEKHYSQPEGIILQYFVFPLYNKYDKKTIREVADSRGWSSIMKMTWFCHRPIFGKVPCGICSPCTFAFDAAFGWRFPIFMRFLNSIMILKILREIRKQIINYKQRYL